MRNIILLPSGLLIEDYYSDVITILSSELINMGVVSQIYDDNGIFSVGDIVVYNKLGAKSFIKNSITYWFINEQDVCFGISS